MKGSRTAAVISILLFCAFKCQARGGSPRGNGTLLSLAPTFSRYSINLKHARDPGPRASVAFAVRRELKVSPDFTSFFIFGVEYFVHGLTFKTYYFPPGSQKIYDKSFGYRYALYLQELSIPLQYKQLFSRGDNNKFSPYLIMGFYPRYMMRGSLDVTQNGQFVKGDLPVVRFRSAVFGRFNTSISLGLGWQRNNITTEGSSFFIELGARYGFTEYSFQTDYAPSSLYMNALHVQLVVGIKL